MYTCFSFCQMTWVMTFVLIAILFFVSICAEERKIHSRSYVRNECCASALLPLLLILSLCVDRLNALLFRSTLCLSAAWIVVLRMMKRTEFVSQVRKNSSNWKAHEVTHIFDFRNDFLLLNVHITVSLAAHHTVHFVFLYHFVYFLLSLKWIVHKSSHFAPLSVCTLYLYSIFMCMYDFSKSFWLSLFRTTSNWHCVFFMRPFSYTSSSAFVTILIQIDWTLFGGFQHINYSYFFCLEVQQVYYDQFKWLTIPILLPFWKSKTVKNFF